MSDTTISRPAPEAADTKHRFGFVKVSGIIIAVIGAIMLIGGASTWVLVQSQLSDEKIVVAEDASTNAGKVGNISRHSISQPTVKSAPTSATRP